MGKSDRTGEVCALIRTGKVSLTDVHRALKDRIEAGEASLEWVIDLDLLNIDGLTGTTSAVEMTLIELEHACEVTGDSWAVIDPITSPKHARAVLEALLVHRAGVAKEATAAALGHVTADVLTRAYELVEVTPADPTSAPET